MLPKLNNFKKPTISMLVEKDDKFMRNFELVTIDENVVNYAQDYESDAEKKKTDVKNDIEKD